MANSKGIKKSGAAAATAEAVVPVEAPAPSLAKAPEKKKAALAAKPVSNGGSALSALRTMVLKVTGQEAIAERRGPIPSLPSGSMCIDDLIGGTLAEDKSGPKCPGYPRKHITEIYGLESSGKTTAAIQAIAAIQAQGGSAVFIDFEHALDHQYARRVGMSFDSDKLALYQPETMEQGWKMIHFGIMAGVDLIVVDSVAAMVPDAEMNKKPGDPPKIGAVAASMSQNLPKVCSWLNSPKYNRNPKGTAIVFLNQIRAVIQTGGGGGKGTSENTAGGNALKYYTYLRLKFTRIKTETLSSKRKDSFTGKEVTIPYGNLTQVKLVKCKVDGKQGYTTEIFIRFNYGIDDYISLIEAAVANRVVSKNSSIFGYEGQKYQGRDKFRKYLMDNPKTFKDLRIKVLNKVRDESLGDIEPESDEDLLLENPYEDELADDGIVVDEAVELEEAADLETAAEEV